MSSVTPVPYRTLMRLQGIPAAPKARRSRPSKVGRCVACGRHGKLSLDHIVPRSRLHDLPQVRDDPANWQMMCVTETRMHPRRAAVEGPGRRWVVRRGCNELKADGPAIDFRPDVATYRRLVRLLARHDVPVDVRHRPEPWRT